METVKLLSGNATSYTAEHYRQVRMGQILSTNILDMDIIIPVST